MKSSAMVSLTQAVSVVTPEATDAILLDVGFPDYCLPTTCPLGYLLNLSLTFLTPTDRDAFPHQRPGIYHLR